MKKDRVTYTELGIKSPDNQRLVNQLKLGEIAHHAGFFPLVTNHNGFDGSQGYEVEIVHGLTLNELMGEIGIQAFIDLLIVAANQLDVLYRSYRIIVKDRNKDNFIYGKKGLDEKDKLYQVDLESLYDAATDTDGILITENLTERRRHSYRPKDRRRAEIEIADVCDSLLEIFIQFLREKKRNQVEQSLYAQLNKSLGAQRITDFGKLIRLLRRFQKLI